MDLLSKLGSKTSAEGTGSPASSQGQTGKSDNTTNNIQNTASRGANLIDQLGNKSEGTAATGNQTTSAEVVDSGKSGSSQADPAGTTGKVDTSSWTLDNALKEIKKLREENKATRIKYEDSVEKMKSDLDIRMDAQKKELENALNAKKELDEVKAKEADRKRTLEERLANREALVAEAQARAEMLEKGYKERLETKERELAKYKAESEAQEAVYKKRLEEELATVPEKFKEMATLLVKGAGDVRDGVIALSEAKIKGVFEDKTVVVNHSVPGANDGARVSNKDFADNAKAAREKMTPQQKIGAALKGMRAGEPNSAFRNR